jgi:hypothetical protein
MTISGGWEHIILYLKIRTADGGSRQYQTGPGRCYEEKMVGVSFGSVGPVLVFYRIVIGGSRKGRGPGLVDPCVRTY